MPQGVQQNYESTTSHTAAEEELQRRQRRLSSIAGAAKAEVESLRAERAQLLEQLQHLADQVAVLPKPPKALGQAHRAAMRCITAEAGKQGACRANPVPFLVPAVVTLIFVG